MEQTTFLSKTISIVVAVIVVAVVLMPICDAIAHGGSGGGGGGGGGSDDDVITLSGLPNGSYVSEAIFMTDELGFRAITDTDITSTFPTGPTPLVESSGTVKYGRAEAYMIDESYYDNGGDIRYFEAWLYYSLYDDSWYINAWYYGVYEIGGWSLSSDGYLTPDYSYGKDNNMPDTYKVMYLWYDAEEGNYHDLGGMPINAKVESNTNNDYSHSLVTIGDYIGVAGDYYYEDADDYVFVIYMGTIGEDWKVEIEFDYHNYREGTVTHVTQTVSLTYWDGDQEVEGPKWDAISSLDNGIGYANDHDNVFTVEKTVECGGGYRPLVLDYEEIAQEIEEYGDYGDFFGVDGMIYSDAIAKVGAPKYIEGDNEDFVQDGTFQQSDFSLIFDNGYGRILWTETGGGYFAFTEDIVFNAVTKITWYNPDYFVRGTVQHTFFTVMGQSAYTTSREAANALVGAFVEDPNGSYLKPIADAFEEAYSSLITPNSWYEMKDGDIEYGNVYLTESDTALYYIGAYRDYVESYYSIVFPSLHASSSVYNQEIGFGSMSQYIFPMSLVYATYDETYDGETTVSVSRDVSSVAATDDDGNNGGIANTLISIIPVFVIMAILMGAVALFYQNKDELF